MDLVHLYILQQPVSWGVPKVCHQLCYTGIYPWGVL